jgi:CheY-like chemotaxis protein
LFVDDEPPVLAVLARLLALKTEQWRMEFAPSAPLALQRLGQSSYDVVVSDLRMPGMSGIELLIRV